MLVEEIARRRVGAVDRRLGLALLLHDAPEYVIGDLISPFKRAVGINYKALENRLQEAIHVRFGLRPAIPETLHRLIKRADTAAAYFEATQLAGFSVEEATRIFGGPAGIAHKRLTPWDPVEAQQRFLKRFGELETRPS